METIEITANPNLGEPQLRELYDDIFTDKLDGWYRDTATWPEDRSYETFCQWFDFRHHSMLVDLCDDPLRCEPY